jgi:hypothetical protein
MLNLKPFLNSKCTSTMTAPDIILLAPAISAAKLARNAVADREASTRDTPERTLPVAVR